ncbi:tetratricopeptide repeat protein [Dyella sp. A6]|uniref:O-linked N-acetylglucosamine transferase, SPINDLY family protein n=1 Tax=Dyella aluminiiresistens TaxID=3069105 RepID=UPI002E76C72F|nr:tetratricopeptide repeat protein [Dyella sp. A6]
MSIAAPTDINQALQRMVTLLEAGDHAGAERFASLARRQFPVAHELIRLHAIALTHCQRIDEARMALNRAAELAPQSVEIQCNLASLSVQQGQPDAAIERLRATLRNHPGHPAVLHGLGTALMFAVRFEQAREAFAMATHGAPEHPGLRVNLAAAELELGHYTQAEKHAREALQLHPRMPPAHALLAHALRAQRRPRAAADAWLQAERLAPGNPEYPYEAGLMLDESGDLPSAMAAWRRALKAAPNLTPALSQLLFAHRRCCDWHDIDRLAAQVHKAVSDRRAGIGPFAFLAEDGNAATQALCATTHAAHVERSNARRRQQLGLGYPAPEVGTAIRTGFVADGFGEHATGLLLIALVEALAGNGLDVHLFATTADDGGPIRQRLAAAATLHDISGLTAMQAARRINDARIEVLFDLNGYCGHDNAELLSLRPAAVQVNWLAYPGTSGAPWMDYLLADSVVVPDTMRQHISEKLVRLPRCFQPNDPTRPLPEAPPRVACGLPESHTVFACFNNSYKLNPAAFARFMLILQQVPDSVLWLMQGPDGSVERLRKAAAALDMDPARLVFLPRLPHADYLAHYAHVDLFLDTLPYNAHTTASDALWTGCPVLTLRGDTFAGRVAASLLQHLGLPELITDDEESFIATAVQLGNNRLARTALRHYLSQQRKASPLFDMQGFAADFQRAVRWMSARYRIGRPPADHDF